MKQIDLDKQMPEARPGTAAEPLAEEWEEAVTRIRPGKTDGAAEEWLPTPPAAFQTGLDSSYREFSQLFAAIERHGATPGPDIDALDTRNGRILGITSALIGEGKTTVALNLAMSTARSTNSKVCLLDLGLTGDSVLHRLGATPQGAGIVHVLEGTQQTFPMLKLRDYDELTIVPAGKIPANPARIARSPQMEEVLCSVRRMFDIILVDMPAVATHNARPLAIHMDGIVMIARAGVTPQEVITNAMDHIGRAKILGVVLNRVQFSGPRWLQKRLMQR